MANFIVIIKQLAKPDYLLIPPTDTAPQFLENLHLISFAYFILWLLGVVFILRQCSLRGSVNWLIYFNYETYRYHPVNYTAHQILLLAVQNNEEWFPWTFDFSKKNHICIHSTADWPWKLRKVKKKKKQPSILIENKLIWFLLL